MLRGQLPGGQRPFRSGHDAALQTDPNSSLGRHHSDETSLMIRKPTCDELKSISMLSRAATRYRLQ